MNRIKILNIEIDNLSQIELLQKLESGVVFTPNADHLIKLQTDREFLKAYIDADYRLCDSQILLYASKFLGIPIKQKISGSDFFPAFYNYHKNNKNTKIFLLGGKEGVAKKAQEKINGKLGRSIVVGAYSPPFGFENDEKECVKIVKIIKQSKATVLAIGVGAPKQEKWIYTYKKYLPNIKVFLAIGATIDFEAGNIKRSPKWMSHLGIEWLYRLLSEPKRLWKRYLIEDLPFFWLILQQKLNLYNNILVSYEQSYELDERDCLTFENQRKEQNKKVLVESTTPEQSKVLQTPFETITAILYQEAEQTTPEAITSLEAFNEQETVLSN